MKALLLIAFASLIAPAAYANPDNCKVSSAQYPELQSGINASTICGETLRELNRNSLATNSDVVFIAEAGRSTYQVNLKISIYHDGMKPIQHLAVLSWWPGGDVQVELVDSLPGQQDPAPARTDEHPFDRL